MMTPEQAAAKAAEILILASETLDEDRVLNLVAVAGGWIHLYAALAAAWEPCDGWDGHPAPVGYVLVQTGWGGENPELCAHGPDPVDQEPDRLLAALDQKHLRTGERLVLCKLIPMTSARSTTPPTAT